MTGYRIKPIREKVGSETLHIRLPASVVERLELMSAIQDRDRAELARKILEDYFLGPSELRLINPQN
jgi:predicted DNA-binding protein